MKYAVLSILAVILLAGVLLIIKSALFRVIKTEENCSASGEKKSFWSKYAGIYESFMKKDERAYEKILADPSIQGPKKLNVYGAPYVWAVLKKIGAVPVREQEEGQG